MVNKNTTKKDLVFSVTYILLIAIVLYAMSPKAKTITVDRPLEKTAILDSTIKTNDLSKAKSIVLTNLMKMSENDNYKKQINEIGTKIIDEDYQKTLTISKSTPLDFDTSRIIVEYCNKLDLPPSLVLALIDLESNFNQYEVGSSNDRGYCQVIPCTEEWLANSYGHLLGLTYDPNKIFEPEYNIGLGMLYLHILKNAYGENYHKILTEYNRGYDNLNKYYSENNTYATSYSRGVLSREKKFENLN